MSYRVKFLLVFLCFLSFRSSADNGFTVQEDINSVILYFRDTSELLTINDVYRLDKTKFEKYDKKVKLEKEGIYWAYFSLLNSSNKALNKILKIGGKRHSDFSKIYVFNQKQIIKYARSGHFRQGSQKDIKEELGSKFSLRLAPKSEYHIYVRIKNISGFSPAFKLEIVDADTFFSGVSKRNLIFGIIQGILWIMLFYNLLIFVYNRNNVYIFYSLYVLGMIFNIATERGLLLEYIIPEIPKLNPFVFIAATGIATASYFQFLRLFLNTKNDMLKWDVFLKYSIYINIAVSALLLFNLFAFFNIPLAINVSNALNFLLLIFGLVFMAYLLKHRSSLALFFIFGTLFLAVGTILNLFFLISKIDPGFETYHLMNIGIVGQILFFSLGLGFKVNQIEKSKVIVQKKLIEQLKRNEELKDKVNRELESKIKERTKEIRHKNEELNTYASELKETNNLLLERNEEINQQKEEIQAIVDMLKETNNKIVIQSNEIEEVNKTLTDSITSAKRIQNAMLPSRQAFEKYFKEHFIIYLPRDIVSGDFYWLQKIKQYIIVTAADSTGHGVPGAFVSMMGMAFLNEIVGKTGITQANEVLDELREQVKKSLNKTGRDNVREGMDMALVVINTKTGELQYSGANNPLYIIRASAKSEKELIHIKPDRQPIGVFRKERPFTNHILQLKKDDVLYLFSDGIVDQFGGKQNEKYKPIRFKKLLLGIHDKTLKEQRKIINNTFDEWRKGYKQVDDIVVLGLKPQIK